MPSWFDTWLVGPMIALLALGVALCNFRLTRWPLVRVLDYGVFGYRPPAAASHDYFCTVKIRSAGADVHDLHVYLTIGRSRPGESRIPASLLFTPPSGWTGPLKSGQEVELRVHKSAAWELLKRCDGQRALLNTPHPDRVEIAIYSGSRLLRRVKSKRLWALGHCFTRPDESSWVSLTVNDGDFRSLIVRYRSWRFGPRAAPASDTLDAVPPPQVRRRAA